MHKHPFTLICIEVLSLKGTPVYKHPIWIILFEERRDEISPQEAAEAYFQRFDIEHFFRFGKGHLLFTRIQTPEVPRCSQWSMALRCTSRAYQLPRFNNADCSEQVTPHALHK